MENNEKLEHLIFREFHRRDILLNERTQTINNTIKLHILGVSMHKLNN